MPKATRHCESVSPQRQRRPSQVTHGNGSAWRCLGVNMRNFEPADLGPVRIRLLDGADTWRTFTWDELA